MLNLLSKGTQKEYDHNNLNCVYGSDSRLNLLVVNGSDKRPATGAVIFLHDENFELLASLSNNMLTAWKKFGEGIQLSHMLRCWPEVTNILQDAICCREFLIR